MIIKIHRVTTLAESHLLYIDDEGLFWKYQILTLKIRVPEWLSPVIITSINLIYINQSFWFGYIPK